MSGPREQTAAAIRGHERTGPPSSARGSDVEECDCAWIGPWGDWPEHVADAVVEALGLIEETRNTYIGVGPWADPIDPKNYQDQRRWVSGWSVVGGEQP